MRTGELGVSYYYTKKEKLGSGESIETERIVDRAEFETLLSDRDNSRAEIVKRRASFHWNGGFFEMDYFLEPTENVLTQNGECLLEVERVDSGRSGSPINLPDFLQNLGEVTADPAYGNYSLSLKN
jgi:CYTH domain-containing protein